MVGKLGSCWPILAHDGVGALIGDPRPGFVVSLDGRRVFFANAAARRFLALTERNAFGGDGRLEGRLSNRVGRFGAASVVGTQARELLRIQDHDRTRLLSLALRRLDVDGGAVLIIVDDHRRWVGDERPEASLAAIAAHGGLVALFDDEGDVEASLGDHLALEDAQETIEALLDDEESPVLTRLAPAGPTEAREVALVRLDAGRSLLWIGPKDPVAAAEAPATAAAPAVTDPAEAAPPAPIVDAAAAVETPEAALPPTADVGTELGEAADVAPLADAFAAPAPAPEAASPAETLADSGSAATPVAAADFDEDAFATPPRLFAADLLEEDGRSEETPPESAVAPETVAPIAAADLIGEPAPEPPADAAVAEADETAEPLSADDTPAATVAAASAPIDGGTPDPAAAPAAAAFDPGDDDATPGDEIAATPVEPTSAEPAAVAPDALPATAEAPAAADDDAAEPASEGFAFRPLDRPIKFVWQMDADRRFTLVSHELAEVVGPNAAAVVGRTWDEVAAALGLDEDGRIAAVLARHDTWSGLTVAWPIEGETLRLPIDLTALPAFDHRRAFAGFRGFGTCRTDGPLPDPTGRGRRLAEAAAAKAAADRAALAAAPDPVPPPAASAAETAAPATAAPTLAAARALTVDRAIEDHLFTAPYPRSPHRDAIGEAARAAPLPPRPEPEPAESIAPPDEADAIDVPATALPETVADLPAVPETVLPDTIVPEAVTALPAVPEAVTALPAAEPVPLPADPEADLAASAFPDDEAIAPAADTPPTGDDGYVGEVDAVDPGEPPHRAAAAPAPLVPAPPLVTTPAAAPAGKVVALAATGRPAADAVRLSQPERNAFRQIAEALGARLEGEVPHAVTLPPAPVAVSPAPPRSSPTIERAAVAAATPSGGFDIRLVDRLPLAVAVIKDDAVVYANERFLALLEYPDLTTLTAEGGLDALFAGEYVARRFETSDGDRPVPVLTRSGRVRPADALLATVPWCGSSALMLTLQELDGESATPARTAVAVTARAPGAETAEAQLRIAELEAVVDTATDGILMLDGDGVVLSANHAAEALFGTDRAAMVGRPLADRLAPESRRSAMDYLDGLSKNGVASVLNDGREVIGTAERGGLIPLFMTIGRVSAEPARKYCVVLRDITHWKKAEEDLTAARRRAEEASVHKSDFLAKISHEIRTPLNAIIGFSEVMMDERFGPIGNDRYKDYLRDIHLSGTHIMSLVNDLLDLSKVEAGKMDLRYEAVTLADIVAESAAMMQPQANRERIIIRSSLPTGVPPVVADPRSVRQIVLNLLSNAIKFTPAGGQVIVSTTLEDSGEVVLRVRDTGYGMTDKELQTAMEPFRQLHTTRSRAGGTGLGLPLTKALVEANRAVFRIDSTVGQGTLVTVTFPVTRVLAS